MPVAKWKPVDLASRAVERTKLPREPFLTTENINLLRFMHILDSYSVPILASRYSQSQYYSGPGFTENLAMPLCTTTSMENNQLICTIIFDERLFTDVPTLIIKETIADWLTIVLVEF